MVWSKWKAAAVLAALACTGLTFASIVYSQQASPRQPTTTASPSNIITTGEPGAQQQQWAIQKMTKLPNGLTAVEVRNLATGAVQTWNTENPPAAWVPTDPKNIPSAPEWSASKQGVSAMKFADDKAGSADPGRFQQMPTGAPKTQGQPQSPTSSGQIRTVDEPGKPSVKCRVMAEWRTTEGHKAAQLQALDSGEIMTMVEMGPLNGGAGKVTAQLYHWGKSTTPPPGVPMPTYAQPSTPMQAPMMQNSMSGQNFEMMPSNFKGNMIEAPKPSFGERVKDFFGGIFSSRNSTPTTMAPGKTYMSNGMEMSGSPMVFKGNNVTMMNEYPVTTEIAKGNPSLKPVDVSRPIEAPKPPETLKMNDAAQLPVVAKSTDGAKSIALPKPPEAVKTNDLPQAPVAAKPAEAPKGALVVPPSPVLATPDTKGQWAPSDPKAPGFGKPSTDTTLPPDVKPSLPVIPAGPIVPLGMGTTSSPTTQAQGANNLPPVPTPAGLAAATRKSDPLAAPENYLPARLDDKLPASKQTVPAAGAGSAVATDTQRPTLGAGSVMAANNGGYPGYVQVPQMPMMPTAQMAQMPDQGNFVNAFTPPMPADAQRQPGYNVPQGYGQMPMPMQGQMPMGYQGPMPPNPMGAMQGYPMPMQPQGYGMPMMPQGYGMPMMPMQPQGYGMPMQPQGYAMPMQPMMPYANPAMDRPGMPVSGATPMQQSVNMLQSSIFPSQREAAVNHLSTCEWRSNPQVVTLMLMAAKEDPCALVRAAAVSGLCRMGVSTDLTMATYNQLKTDADPRVRHEAEQALARTAPGSGVLPASVRQ